MVFKHLLKTYAPRMLAVRVVCMRGAWMFKPASRGGVVRMFFYFTAILIVLPLATAT